ncbi:hypothetical protein VT84_13485 [Gemmata sp. SH-PL17]|uniref:hypothetical protein n=1 Tax=Gemmata sp. SH-PL17 TaxID=1630693 RepID=UPI00078D8BC0|nr:hypothetical protein [Gemmata sp. SH-PL17]AMV25408.1 hypothetical protein VT84_13485 [Gemmata sp. SH-PL17]
MSADVRSIAAVVDWHAALTNYGDGLSEAMAGVDLEIRRAFDWLGEQLARWQRAVRDCEEEVVRAKAELAQRKFPTWDGRDPDCTVQEKALRLAKARQEHAEEKVETVRRWIGRLPKMIDEMFTGPSRRLKSILEADLPNALTEVTRRIGALESYAGLRPDYAPGPSTSGVPTPPAPLPKGKGEEESSTEDAVQSAVLSPSPLRGGVGEGLEKQPPLPPAAEGTREGA